MKTLRKTKPAKILFITLALCLLTISPVGAGELEGKTIYVNNKQIEPVTTTLLDYQEFDLKTVENLHNGSYEYINYPLGYRCQYPQNMTVDLTHGNICTVFSNDECRIEIYYQPLMAVDYLTYIGYSNNFLLDKKTYLNQKQYTCLIGGHVADVVEWERPALTGVNNDFPYYLQIDVKKNMAEAYSIFIESKNKLTKDSPYRQVVSSLSFQTPFGKYCHQINLQESELETQMRLGRLNEKTKALYLEYFANDEPLKWGIFEPEAPNDMHNVFKMEYQLKTRFDCLVRYHHLFSDNVPIGKVIEDMKNAYGNHRFVELTLQTTDVTQGNRIYEILNGEHDVYLTDYAEALADYGEPILLRLANEMNGDWCVYSAYHYGKDTSLYREFYIYLYNIFEKAGANKNVLWVWNPNEKSFPDFTWNDMQMYYPGNRYVDIVGLTGYNTGTYYEGETWRTFNEIYGELYQDYVAMFSQPLMITEFASSSVGGDKVAWIKDMFEQLPNYPKLKMAVWWSGCDWDYSTEEPTAARIYRLDENAEVMQAFAEGLQAAQKRAEEAEIENTETTYID